MQIEFDCFEWKIIVNVHCDFYEEQDLLKHMIKGTVDFQHGL